MAKKTTIDRFWNVRAENTATGRRVGHLYLYGVIASESWYGDMVSPRTFREDLEDLGEVDELRVHIFSDGGDVWAGNTIYSLLRQYHAPVYAYVEGIAASIATVIMCGADKVYVSRNAALLIHNAMFCLYGMYNAPELAVMIRDLRKTNESLIGTYERRTGMTREEITEIMDGEEMQGTWFTAQEAIDNGLADGFIPEESEAALGAVACIADNVYQWQGHTFNLQPYPNAPKITNRRTNSMSRKATKKRRGFAAFRRPRNELITVTCPDCGAVFEWETDEIDEVVEAVEAEARRNARAIGRPVNATHSVTCPECGATFDWSDGDDITTDGADLEEIPAEANRARVLAHGNRYRARAEAQTITCPECGCAFEWTEPQIIEEGDGAEARHRARAARGRPARAEAQTVTCPDCGCVFEWAEPEIIEEGSGGEARRSAPAARGHRARAEAQTVTCPDCGCTFEWTEPEIIEEGDGAEARRRARAETSTATCPDCGCVFEFDADTGEADESDIIARRRSHAARGRRARAEVQTVTCPDCGCVFEWAEPEIIEEGGDVQAGRTRAKQGTGYLAARKAEAEQSNTSKVRSAPYTGNEAAANMAQAARAIARGAEKKK